jgi:hypothetical protein
MKETRSSFKKIQGKPTYYLTTSYEVMSSIPDTTANLKVD